MNRHAQPAISAVLEVRAAALGRRAEQAGALLLAGRSDLLGV